MRGPRGRWIGAGAALAAALVVVVGVTVVRPPERAARARPSGGPHPPTPVAVGPLVYYEILDADGSHLMERRLDGHSLARGVASRTDVEYGRTWIVDPAGVDRDRPRPRRGRREQRSRPSRSRPAPPCGRPGRPTAPVEQAVWSPADGQRRASPDRHGHRASARPSWSMQHAAVRAQVAVPDDAIVQGFDARRRPDPPPARSRRGRASRSAGASCGWIRRPGRSSASPTLPDVGPASDWSEDVDPRVGLAVDTTIGGQRPGHGDPSLAAPRRCRRGSSRRSPSVDRIAIDPAGHRGRDQRRPDDPLRRVRRAGRRTSSAAPTRSPTSPGPRAATTSRWRRTGAGRT